MGSVGVVRPKYELQGKPLPEKPCRDIGGDDAAGDVTVFVRVVKAGQRDGAYRESTAYDHRMRSRQCGNGCLEYDPEPEPSVLLCKRIKCIVLAAEGSNGTCTDAVLLIFCYREAVTRKCDCLKARIGNL